MPQLRVIQREAPGVYPTYCFDSESPDLRVIFSSGGFVVDYDQVIKTQGRYLAGEILFHDAERKILIAKVDAIEGIDQHHPALTPSSDAKIAGPDKFEVSAKDAERTLIKKMKPVYPQDAKDAEFLGKVVFHATIGRDGGIRELLVVSTPWSSMTSSAFWAVSHWQYRPYMINGEPVEVRTTINVNYALGQ